MVGRDRRPINLPAIIMVLLSQDLPIRQSVKQKWDIIHLLEYCLIVDMPTWLSIVMCMALLLPMLMESISPIRKNFYHSIIVFTTIDDD
jgi:hypothetical protein